jgi:hypothetical protein
MLNQTLIRILMLFSVLIASCRSDGDKIAPSSCPYSEEAPPRYLFAPDSAKTDSTITITVVYNNQKHCQQFDSFSSSSVDSTTTIALQTKIDSCNCQTHLELQYKYFHYQAPSNPGHSIIRIHVVDTLFYSDTIVVY